ncbi:Fanconi anemia group D2 protein-like isoform X2 [Corticium candelabrum]|uniref:Fanconi anemia group D2 protein-like isoform X2 n=1 Tax=Corticium candelabrum TaxID=121492 RepID=UPI002E270B3C|nr:Fanconi anemia group D2 protein-like isoform X2 [Corticium candelabrum]
MANPRSRKRSERQNSNSKRRKDAAMIPCDEFLPAETSMMTSLLAKFSCRLSQRGEKRNELGIDQALFQRQLHTALKQHSNYPQVTDDFVEQLQDHFSDPDRFKCCLLPTVVPEAGSVSARVGHQDSLAQLLLGVDLLQPKVITVLLEKLPEFSDDDKGPGGVNMANLIMAQLKWLDHIVKSKDLARKVMEVLPVLSLISQRDVVSALPEIVVDSDHSDVASALKDLMSENVELTAPVIDALTNLNVDSKLLSEIQESLLKILPSSRLEDLPVAIHFIQQSLTPSNAVEIIAELREKLDFASTVLPMATSTPAANVVQRVGGISNTPSNEHMSELQAVEMIRAGIRFQKYIADAWIKAIENVESPEDYKAIDILILLVLHCNTGRKKMIESLLRTKVKLGAFSEELVASAFSSHSRIILEYFPSLLVLSDVLLRSTDSSVSSFASTLYRHAFTSFDGYYRQEVVGSLVTHIGSGFSTEIDAALDVLTNLVETCSSAMTPYAVFLKGVSDYLDTLTLAQIRKLFSMLSWLAIESPGNSGMIQDDMHIIIRKQLSNTSKKYKRIGVIGAVMAVKGLARKRTFPAHLVAAESQAGSLGSSTLPDDTYKQVISLLELVKRNSVQHSEITALFYDELASVLHSSGGLDPKVQSWISESVVEDFQDTFLVDTKTNIPDEPFPLQRAHGLDDGGEVVINLIPLLYSEMNNEKSQRESSELTNSSVTCLCPQFRLVQMCEACQTNGSLEGIDALLGCPVFLCKDEVMDQFETLPAEHRQLVINAFCTQESMEIRGKVLVRLKSVTELQSRLTRCLAATPTYTPPMAHFDAESLFEAVDGGGKVSVDKLGKVIGKRGRSKKKATGDKTGSMDGSETLEQTGKEISISLAGWRQHFRELDLNVFKVLTYMAIARKLVDSESHTKEVTVLQLGHLELQFLLEDLKLKLSHCLAKKGIWPGMKGRKETNVGFSHLSAWRPQQVVVKVMELMPALCDHLESVATYFQDLVEENDGIVDYPVGDQEKWTAMCNCFQLIIEIFRSLLSWPSLSSNENRLVLKQILKSFSDRGPSCSSTRIKSGSIQEMSKLAFAYLEQFSTSAPNLSTAVSLVCLLSILADQSQTSELKPLIGTMATSVLKRDWPDILKEKSSRLSEWILPLVKYHIAFSEDPVAVIEAIVGEGFPQLMEEDAVASKLYPTLTRATSVSFYRSAAEELVNALKVDAACKRTAAVEVQSDRLLELDIIVRVFHILVKIVKSFDARGLVSSALKIGRSFLDTFLRFGMPVLERVFKTNKDDVLALLKNLQLSTRSLQHFCGHSKVAKNMQLVNHVPGLKKTLEAFVFRVKAMLAIHNCQEAFWLGNLKNRNLQGEEIASQSQVSVTTSEALSQRDDDDEEDKDNYVNEDEPGSDEERDVGEGSPELYD